MKLFKKSEPKDDPKKASAAPSAPENNKSKGRFKRFTAYQYGMIVVVLLAFVISGLLLDKVVLTTSESDAVAKQSQQAASLMNGVFEFQVRHFTRQVQAIANSSTVLDSLDSTDEFNTRQHLVKAFPYMEKSFLFKKGGIKLRLPDGEQLSFASLDMLKRIEKGESMAPEAFKIEDKWHIQVATPVLDDGGNLAGTLLLQYSPQLFSDLFKGTQGKVSIIQVQGETESAFVDLGAGNGEVYMTVSPTVKIWKLAYQLPDSSTLLDRTFFWSVMGACSLLGVLGGFVLLSSLFGSLRKDIITVTEYANRLLVGERRRAPQVAFGNFDAMVRSMERANKAGEKKRGASPEPVASPKPAAPKAKSPVKSDAGATDSGLDVDMVDGDDDMLGMGAPVEEAPAATMPEESAPLFGDDDLLSDESLDLSLDDVMDADEGGLMGDSMMDEGDDGLEISETEAIDAPAEIFRAYDIRGVVGDNITPSLVTHLGRAIGSEARAQGQSSIVVGYDGRLSSPELANALVAGLVQTGLQVIQIGQVPTPVLYFATHQLGTGSGVMVTGSHNPAEYNGFKIMLNGDTLAGEAIQKLYKRIVVQDYTSGQGSSMEQDVSRDYTDAILNDIAVAAPLRVVVDAGNGVAGELAPMIIEELGCEVIPLYCDIDGNFPNHHPDPGKPENLQALKDAVIQEGADIGIAFDGDGDRLGVVTNEGKIIWPDRLLMLFAKDVVSRNPGADIIFDVKCTRRLNALISEYGGRPIMWKTGHSLIKAKMKETGALLAGEMSGHVFFKERWFGFDDAIYSASRLLEILGLDERPAEEIFAALPEDVSTPEINIPVDEAAKFSLVEALGNNGQFGDGNISNIDGVRVDYADGWGLCRASNTTPMLVLRFEASDDAALLRIQEIFKQQLLKVDDNLTIPF